MNRRIALAVAGTAVLAAAIAITSIALADRAGPTDLTVLGVGAPARPSAFGGDSTGADPKRAASDTRLAGPVEYRVAGTIPALGGELAAWRLDDSGIDPDRVAALAKRLGVDGRVDRNEWGDWVVNGVTHQLTVSAQPGNPWYLSPAPVELSPDQPVAACDADPCPEPVRPAGLPTKATAERIGTELLRRLGLDLAATSGVRVDDGFSAWFVSATPTVGDLPVIGMDWSVSVGVDNKIEFANGWLDRPMRGDTYPLIGTTAAIEKLREQWAGGLGGPQTQLGVRCMDCPDGVGEPFVHTITGAHLAYQVLYADLVPTYVLETKEGGELFAYAVGDQYLKFPADAQPLPIEEPMTDPAPTGKG